MESQSPLFTASAQGAHRAEDALVGAVFQLRPEAVQCLGGAVLDGLGHLLGAVGGDGLDGLHRAERPVDDLVLRLGDDLLLFGGAVRESLGHGLGSGLDPVREGRGGGRHGVHHVSNGLHGLADRPLAVCRDGLHGLDVLEHAVHHLTAGGGDDLLLLGRAVGQRLGDSLGGGGHAVLDRRGGVADGFDDVRRGLFGALGGRGGRSGSSGSRCRRVCGPGGRLQSLHAAFMQLLAALPVCVRGGVGLSGDSFLYAITYCGGRSVDECRDFLLDKGSKRPPQIGDTGNNPSDDVFADMSPFLHAAVRCTDKFGDAGIGGLKQIFDAVKDAVYQCGEHCCTTFQNVGQMGNEGSGKPGDKVRCRCDEVWQTVRDTDDEIFQQLDTAVENVILINLPDS